MSDPGQTHYVGDGCEPAHENVAVKYDWIRAIDRCRRQVMSLEEAEEFLAEVHSRIFRGQGGRPKGGRAMSGRDPAEANFEGLGGFGEHRTTGGRAWCLADSEWCYPQDPCRCCELPLLQAVAKAAREAWDDDSTDLMPEGIKARLRDALAALPK